MELEAVLKKILEKFDNDYRKSSRIRALKKNISEGVDHYAFAEEIAKEVGGILTGALRAYLPEALTNGMLFRKEAEVVLKQPMLHAVKPVSDAASSVQKNINTHAGIGINPIIPEVNEDQVNGIITGICNAESYESGKETLFDQIENFMEGHVDDYVQKNAGFQYEAGLDPTLRRTAAAKCCKWCDQLAGTYDYEKVRNKGNDVWKRHKNCHCVIDYNPGEKSTSKKRFRFPSTESPEEYRMFYEENKRYLELNERGYFEARAFGDQWEKASLQESIEKYAKGAIAKTDEKGRKIFYSGPRYEIIYDPGGNYFRIKDKMSQSKNKKYVRLDGSPILFNITENGKERGVTKSEYNMWTHFLNTDQLEVR